MRRGSRLSRRRRRGEEERRGEERRRGGEEEQATDIKSNNPHLAGGEKKPSETKPMHQPRSYYNAFGSTTDASMQQLQCDLLPHVAEHQGRTDSILKRPQPHPPHRRYLEIAGCSHLTRKNTTFRAPASSPKHTPCNMNTAITMRFAAPPTSMQTLQCDLHPHVAEQQGRTDSTPETTAAAPAAQRRTLSSPAAATLHGKTRFVLRLPPQKTKPCNNHAAITMRLAAPPTHPCSH